MALEKRKLTLQQMEFIKCLFSPEVMFNATEAYRKAYPKCKAGHQQAGSRMLLNVVVKEAIAQKRAELSREMGFTIEEAQRMYKEDREFATKCGQAGARVTATTGICRLYGMDKDAGQGEKTIIIISPKAPKVIESVVSEPLEANTGDNVGKGQDNGI